MNDNDRDEFVEVLFEIAIVWLFPFVFYFVYGFFTGDYDIDFSDIEVDPEQVLTQKEREVVKKQKWYRFGNECAILLPILGAILLFRLKKYTKFF